MNVVELTHPELEERARSLSLNLPIEQTERWSRFEATIEGRTPWGCLALEEDGETRALMALVDYQTHGYHYLRSVHGPAWVTKPSAEEEARALEALAAAVRRRDGRVAFIRLAVHHYEQAPCEPVLSTIPYNETVIADITGDAEQILARMKTRGRRDVRKALRETPITCADETERATRDFSEYYQVMVETAERDGFVPARREQYENMTKILGPEHCRVFAGRTEADRLVTWSICTISGTRATRYYGASVREGGLMGATDMLAYHECCMLGALGCTSFDLMGIGNEFAPSLKGLNTFKTKFAKESTPVAPDRDLPVRRVLYAALTKAKAVMKRGA